MKIDLLGEVIREKRVALGLTQLKLSDGICEPITISRLENGTQVPSFSKLQRIFQKLDLPESRYHVMLTTEEIEIEELQKRIVSCNVRQDPKEGIELLNQLKKLAVCEEAYIQQFILRSRVILGEAEPDGTIHPYPLPQQLEMLMDALRLTSPEIDLEELNKYRYTVDEAKVINQIANVYSNMGEYKKAADIYYQLLKYVKKNFRNITQSGGLLPLVSFNYARTLDLLGHYQDAIELAKEGQDACIRTGKYSNLPGDLAIIAECYHRLGDDAQSREYYLQSYYIDLALKRFDRAEKIKKEMNEYLGIEP